MRIIKYIVENLFYLTVILLGVFLIATAVKVFLFMGGWDALVEGMLEIWF